MNRRDGRTASQSNRVEWGGYGFAAGILVGVILGWMFAGFVGAFVRVAIVAIVIVPVVLAYIAWRRFVAPLMRPQAPPPVAEPYSAIETREVVHGITREPQPR